MIRDSVSQSAGLKVFLSRTGNLLLHLLNTCNLKCKHCYLEAEPRKRAVLPLDLLLRVIAEADEMNLRSIQFSGGEPFLHPSIDEILRATLEKRFSVTVSTNATLMTDAHISLLTDINARVVTSVDGPPEFHDGFRGKSGSFVKTERAVLRLIEKGVPVNIVMTVCTDNLAHVEWCAEYAKEINAESIQFQPLDSIGRGRAMSNKCLQEAELHDLFIMINDLAVAHEEDDFKFKMTFQSREFMRKHPCTAFVCNGKRCHRGVAKELKKIVIREDGTILPELVDIDRRFAIGNLYEGSLAGHLLRYLESGYADFDRFCRDTYRDFVVNSSSPLIPWNQILTERSKEYRPPSLPADLSLPIAPDFKAWAESGTG